MGKSENYILFGNYCSHRPQTFYQSIQINELMKLNDFQRSRALFNLAKGHSDFNIKSCFSRKPLSHLEPNFLRKLLGEWELKFIHISRVT